MSSWVKRVLNIFLFIAGFNIAERLCHEETDGFTMQRIFGCSNLPTSALSSEAKEILRQKFSYFAKGNQCYVFLSEDGRHILKLFKYAENIPLWTGQIPLLNRFKPFRPSRIDHRAWKKERDALGYQMADQDWKEEAGLLFAHLAPSEGLLPPITISDKLHIEHSLDLNQVNFVLQKRGDVLHEKIKNWMESGQQERAEAALAEAVDFCLLKASRGILDDDGALHNNLGFIGEKLVQLDPGHFKHHTFKDPKQEARRAVRHLTSWLDENYPTLVPHVEDRLSRL